MSKHWLVFKRTSQHWPVPDIRVLSSHIISGQHAFYGGVFKTPIPLSSQSLLSFEPQFGFFWFWIWMILRRKKSSLYYGWWGCISPRSSVCSTCWISTSLSLVLPGELTYHSPFLIVRSTTTYFVVYLQNHRFPASDVFGQLYLRISQCWWSRLWTRNQNHFKIG